MDRQKGLKDYFLRYRVPLEVVDFVTRPVGHHIHGRIEHSSAHTEIFEPFTQCPLTTVSSGSADDVDRAVASARQALAGPWGRISSLERQKLLLKLAHAMREDADLLAHIEAINVGKSISDARTIDVFGAIANFEYFAGWTSKLDGRTPSAVSLPRETLTYTIKEPVGVVAAIVPWNFPLQILSWKLAAALACGCTVICKPSELTPLSAMHLAQLATQVGFPDGVFNVINGLGTTVGKELSTHPGVNKLSFTGSTAVGIAVGRAAIEGVKRLTLELGGKSPVIVTKNANLDVAASAILSGVFLNSGQVCDAGSRVYAHASIYGSLVEKLKAGAESMAVGPGLDPSSRITPLISRAHRTKVLSHIMQAHDEGAAVVTGGTKSQDRAGDDILRPTIFEDCTDEMRIFREEIFGPVLGVGQYTDIDEAVARANASAYGLAAAIYTENVGEAHLLARRIKSGNVYVNAHGLLDPTMPFGGVGASGFGKEMGPEQLDGFLSTKSVYVQLSH